MVEIIDEYGNHVCWVDEGGKEFKRLKRQEKAKEIGATVLAIGVVAGKAVVTAAIVGGLAALGIKAIRGK